SAGFKSDGTKGDHHEFYAKAAELRFERAYAANQYLPEEDKYRTALFVTHGYTYDDQVTVEMPDYKRLNGGTFTIPIQRFPEGFRTLAKKKGTWFECIA